MFPLYDENPTERLPIVTVLIVVANALAFVWEVNLPPPKLEQVVVHNGFVPARLTALEDNRVVSAPGEFQKEYPLAPDANAVYRSAFTCMFLHGSWMHLIGNMWFLWLFGNNIEDRIGHLRFVIFYLLGGLAATGVHWYVQPLSSTPVIGASGAVSAVLGAYAVTFPHARVKTLVVLIVFITFIDLPALIVLGFWFLTQLLEAARAFEMGQRGLISGGVAWWAHVGGFVMGLVSVQLFKLGVPYDRPQRFHRTINRYRDNRGY